MINQLIGTQISYMWPKISFHFLFFWSWDERDNVTTHVIPRVRFATAEMRFLLPSPTDESMINMERLNNS